MSPRPGGSTPCATSASTPGSTGSGSGGSRSPWSSAAGGGGGRLARVGWPGACCRTAPGSSSTSRSRTSAWRRWPRRRTGPRRPSARSGGRVMTAGYAGIAGLVAHPGLLQLKISPGLSGLYPAAAWSSPERRRPASSLLARRPASDRAFRPVCLLPHVAPLLVPVFVFGSPYAAVGGMTIAHGLQYLLLVGLVAAGTGADQAGRCRLAVLGNVALVGGAVLSGRVPPARRRRPPAGCSSAPTWARSWPTSSSTRACGGCATRFPGRSSGVCAGTQPGCPLADRSSADI